MKLFIKLKQYFLDKSESVSILEKKINYIFHNKDYLNQAFTHKSLNKEPRKNYERLEFLGDAVIDIIVSRELMREFPEGDVRITLRKCVTFFETYLITLQSIYV